MTITTPAISHTLLLVEDDTELSDLLAEYLRSEGFTVQLAFDGDSAVEKAKALPFAAIVLDVQLPGQNGFDALREIRRFSTVPVIMLTARGEEIDRIIGLELGADDYMPKPCNPRELSARLRAILRRTASQNNASAHHDDASAHDPAKAQAFNSLSGNHSAQPRDIDGVSLCQSDRTVTQDGQALILTSAEFNILAILLKHAGQVVSKDALSEQALGRKLSLYDRSTDMHISNLRKKLGPRHDGTQRIKTVRGQGYLYVAPSPTPP